MTASALRQNPHRLFQRKWFLVETPGSKGVEEIGHGEDSGIDRNIVPPETGLISGPVEFFVMITDDICGILIAETMPEATGIPIVFAYPHALNQ